MRSFADLHDEYLTKKDQHTPCFVCGEMVHEDDVEELDGNFYCQDCYRELPYCSNCHSKRHDLDLEIWTDDDGFCDQDCYDEWKLLNQPVGT